VGGEHHYTLDADERDMLVNAGWNDEGIGWYSANEEGVPVYREYNPNQFACNHNFTTDKAEHDGLVDIGWTDEGIAWYAVEPGYTKYGHKRPFVQDLPEPLPVLEEGTGENQYPVGTIFYYKGAVYTAISDMASDAPEYLPDGENGGAWEKIFDAPEVTAGDGSNAFPEGTRILYKGTIYEAQGPNLNDWPDNLPDGQWGSGWGAIVRVAMKGLPETIDRAVSGDGSITYPNGTYVYYNGAVYKSINDASNDWPDNLPDGQWGAGCWEHQFDAPEVVAGSGENKFAAGTKIYYKGRIYESLTDNADDWVDNLPDGKWGGSVWKLITSINGEAEEQNPTPTPTPVPSGEGTTVPDPLTVLTQGSGSVEYPVGSVVYYKNAVYQANTDTNDWTDNLPDGQWGNCWTKLFDAPEAVAGDGSITYPEGTYILYGTTIYKSINNNSSNWPDNLPDGQWAASCWEKVADLNVSVE
jgi:hypothetical protein